MGLSTSVVNEMLDWFFGNEQSGYMPPTTFYVALIKDDSNEVTGGSYARVQTDTTDWAGAVSGEVVNANAVTFPAPTADWGLITYFKLYDQVTGGTQLAVGDLTSQVNVLSGGTTPEFTAGNLIIRIT